MSSNNDIAPPPVLTFFVLSIHENTPFVLLLNSPKRILVDFLQATCSAAEPPPLLLSFCFFCNKKAETAPKMELFRL
jgi:hypothetical protein